MQLTYHRVGVLSEACISVKTLSLADRLPNLHVYVEAAMSAISDVLRVGEIPTTDPFNGNTQL